MLMVFNRHIFFIVLISITSGMPSIKRQIKLDKICGETRSVLCVNSVLTIIATSATNIERLANDIEQHILNKSHIVGRLNALVNSEMNSIRAHLPVSKYHGILPNLSNIDKEFLGHLLKEAHYASSYYYNSIADILDKNDASHFRTDSEFKKIPDYLSDIICQYRSILAVYSLEWPLTYQVTRIQLSGDLYRETSSTVRDAHTLIVTKLLHDWMKRIRSFIDNLDTKYH